MTTNCIVDVAAIRAARRSLTLALGGRLTVQRAFTAPQ
jgi:hypothetical protein